VPVPLWLYWWQRGTLSPSASLASLTSVSTSPRAPEDADSSDDSDDGEEATIQVAQPASRRRSTSISLSPTSPRRELAVPSLGGIPMSREASWDGSAYSRSPKPTSPPLVRRTEEGLLDW
jgi:hypothetical protein